MTSPRKPRKWARASHATLLSTALALAGCAPNAIRSLAGTPTPPPGAIINDTLPVSVADLPQAAALRTAPRLALVVGNSAYRASPLRLPGKDAQAIAQVLAQRGFELIGGSAQLDVSSQRLRQLIDTTEQRVRANPGAIVVVYFAGHGFVDQGHNYLVPVDVSDSSQAVSASIGVVSTAQRLHAAGSGLTVMLLDACRTYLGTKGGGLTDEAAPDNTFIGFAAQFGAAAGEPANGSHGYYTSALLENIDVGFDRFDDLHLAVGRSVLLATGAEQTPVFREGEQMPATPIRVASNDPQTAFALARRRNTPESALAAQRCAAEADFRIVFSGADLARQFNGDAMLVGPSYEPADLIGIEQACANAYAGGHRDATTLRGLAIARIFLAMSGARPFKPGEAADSIALLAQAAESGDALSNLFLAFAAADSQFGLPSNVAKDRLIAAAKPNESPISGFVGMTLWGEDGAAFRQKAVMPEYKTLGIQLFKSAVLNGDPFAVEKAYIMRSKGDPIVADIQLQTAFEKSFKNKSSFGVYVRGTSVRETLYTLATLHAFVSKDYLEFVHLVLQGDPFLDKTMQAMGRAGGPGGGNAGKLLVAAGCMLATGHDLAGAPIPGLTPNINGALILLHKAALDGMPVSNITAHALATGGCRFRGS
jgi:hypothetical protein